MSPNIGYVLRWRKVRLWDMIGIGDSTDTSKCSLLSPPLAKAAVELLLNGGIVFNGRRLWIIFLAML
jgi:hypothetical protein